jgi:molybdopterin-guanine dinucleotide biosynthesis protein B
MKPGEAKIFGVVGWSGSGKTTLMIELLPDLIRRGFRVSTMKHTHHNFDIDKPGKDSFRHREAGAHEVLITGARRWALLHENRDDPEPHIDSLLANMAPVDLVLIEGFKSHSHKKLEVYRPSVGKEMIAAGDDSIVAVASDEPLPEIDVPVLDLNNVASIGDFVAGFCGLDRKARDGAA